MTRRFIKGFVQRKHMENIVQWFQDTAEKRGEEPCLRFKTRQLWKSLNWIETLSQVIVFSESLKKIGVKHQDTVALLSITRHEWTILDMAILSLGGVTVPIYQSTLPDDVGHILNDSGARVIIVENSTQLEKILKIRSKLPHLEKIILIDGKVLGEGIMTFKEFRSLGEGVESDFGSRIRDISGDDLATLVYTSGTTGAPKGVMITHGNVVCEVAAIMELFPLSESAQGLLFLPLAHILARIIQFFQLAKGFTHAYAESIDKLVDDFQEIHPEFMVSVPRIFEKIYQNMMHNVENSSSLKQGIFYWSQEIGKEYSQLIREKKPIPLALKIRYSLANRLVFSKLHNKLGGRIKFFVSGGAPLAPEIAEFFHGAGLLILEGYGLTETTGAVNCNSAQDYRFGTVGKPVKGAEEKLAEDGEILVRGSTIAKGYWKNPNATKESFDLEGWFHTGDIGEFDEEGYLKITDRKKDIIVTAAGKNIAPQNIENVVKLAPLISQVVVHGDRRKYLSALITLDQDKLLERARELGMNGKSVKELVKSPIIYDEIKRVIEEKNKEFAKFETIKKFAILHDDFTVESGELTPTLKVKRKVISEKYKRILDSLYRD